MIGQDPKIEDLIFRILSNSRKTEFGRTYLPKLLAKLPHLYLTNGRFANLFYPLLISDYLQTEIST